MAITLMKFPEIEKDITGCDYKSVALVDKNGNQLVPYNSKQIKLETKLLEIGRRLQSKALPAGVYQVHARHWGHTTVPCVYYVQVGSGAAAIEDIEIQGSNSPAVNRREVKALSEPGTTISWEKYQELFVENMTLQQTVDRLQLEIDMLHQQIENLEEELDEAPGGEMLSDGTKEWVSGLIETVTPLVDKYQEQRDKQLQIAANQVYNQTLMITGQKPPAAQQQNNGVADHGQEDEEEEEDEELTEEQDELLDKFEYLKQIDPELYEKTIRTVLEATNNPQ